VAPLLAGSVIGASYADRHDRRRLMIGADLLRLGLLLGLADALLHGPVPLWALAGFALAEGSASAMPHRVPRRRRGLGLRHLRPRRWW
jgi:hypothetical protein